MKRIAIISIFILTLTAMQVYAVSPSLQVSTVVNPINIYPGEDGFVQITITNIGTVSADKVSVRLFSIDRPLLSRSLLSATGLGSLGPGNSVSTQFLFSVPENTPKGLYNIQFQIESCQGGSCSDFLQNAVVNVKTQTTNFEVNIQETSGNKVSLSVANVGINPAIAVSINIPDQDNFTVVGPSSAFLGNLDSGDFTTADFTLIPAKNNTLNNLRVEISYTDSTGKRHTLIEQTPLLLITGLQTTKTTSDNSLYIGAVVVLLIVGFLYYRRRRGRKQ